MGRTNITTPFALVAKALDGAQAFANAATIELDGWAYAIWPW